MMTVRERLDEIRAMIKQSAWAYADIQANELYEYSTMHRLSEDEFTELFCYLDVISRHTKTT